MRTRALLCAALTALGTVACSYYYSVRAELQGDVFVLDTDASTRQFLVKACFEGKAEPETVQIEILAWATDSSVESATGPRITTSILDDGVEVDEMTLSDFEPNTGLIASFSDHADACDEGTVVTHEIDDPSKGPIEIEWRIVAIADSSDDEELEKGTLEIVVEAL